MVPLRQTWPESRKSLRRHRSNATDTSGLGPMSTPRLLLQTLRLSSIGEVSAQNRACAQPGAHRFGTIDLLTDARA